MESTTVTTAAITEALVSGLNTAAVSMIDTLASLLPIALTVMTSILVVAYGIKVFKKITGR